MTTRKIVLFAIAFVLLILVIAQTLSGPRAKTTDDELRWVVAANQDIPPYTLLTGSELITTTVRLADSQDAFLAEEKSSLAGRMTTQELRAGNVVPRSSVIALDPNWSDEMLIFSFYVPTARIIGGQLRPGHHIDLLATRTETREEVSQSLWLARNLWVVDVYQSTGADVLRPDPSFSNEGSEPQPTATRSGLGLGSVNGMRTAEGPANLVVVAAHPETARLIGDYLGARLYDAWVYVRPGGASAGSLGGIEGVVFEDQSLDLIQQRNEPGLDDVQIVLRDAQDSAQSVNTASGGRFSFPDLVPGTYYVEERDPEGYSSLTSNRLQVIVAPGLNQHLLFADVRGSSPAASGPQETGGSQANAVATPAPAETTAVGQRCACTVRMSDKQDGAAMPGDFAAGTQQVWAVISFSECPAGTPYRVLAYAIAEGAAGAERGKGTWKGGAGTLSLPLSPWNGSAFGAGDYVTEVRLGTGDELGAYVPWTVAVNTTGKTDLPQVFPQTGQDGSTDPESLPQTHFGFSPVR